MKLLLSLFLACLLLLPNADGAETESLTGADRAAVVEGNKAFAFALYHKLCHQGGNLFFSPESISTALAMAYAGAGGATASLPRGSPIYLFHSRQWLAKHFVHGSHDRSNQLRGRAPPPGLKP